MSELGIIENVRSRGQVQGLRRPRERPFGEQNSAKVGMRLRHRVMVVKCFACCNRQAEYGLSVEYFSWMRVLNACGSSWSSVLSAVELPVNCKIGVSTSLAIAILCAETVANQTAEHHFGLKTKYNRLLYCGVIAVGRNSRCAVLFANNRIYQRSISTALPGN